MVKQRKYQADFLTVATGGPNIYEGMDMKEAHKKLGIKKLEFDAAWQNLEASFRHHGAQQEMIDELKAIFYSAEEDIVQKE